MTGTSPQTLSLARTEKTVVDLTVLEPVAAKLTRGIHAALASCVNADVRLAAASAHAARYPEWRIAQNPFGAIIRVRWTGCTEELLVYLPGFLVSQLVDLHYGGTGHVPASGEFSAAELRFIERLADQFAPVFEAIFEPFGLSPGISTELHTNMLFVSWPKSREDIAVQPITVDGPAIKSATINIIMAIETIRRVSSPSNDNGIVDSPAHAAWAMRVREAAMQIRLPARTVLTRDEVAFQKLLTLAPGDILPLLLPAQIPLTVAGRTFAHGTLGEANGRAALMIEKLEKEPDL